MDYGHLLRKAWDLVWNNKWLFLLGLIAALVQPGGNNGGNTSSWTPSDEEYTYDESTFDGEFDPEDFFGEDIEFIAPLMALGTGVLILLGIGIALIGIAFWAASTIAHGGLIAGVNTLADGGTSSFAEAWGAAWKKGWRLIGIALIPAIPIVVLLVIAGFLIFGAVTSAATLTDQESILRVLAGLGGTWIVALCLMAIFAAVLNVWHHFARRACMIEDTSVFESYRRSWEVIRDNFGNVVVLFIIVVLIKVGLGLVLFLPGVFVAICLCCIAWAISWAANAAFATYFSAVWTLAWRAFTGLSGKSGEPLVDSAPAV